MSGIAITNIGEGRLKGLKHEGPEDGQEQHNMNMETSNRVRKDNSRPLAHHQQSPLLARPIAKIVSSISMASRVSIRLSALVVDSIFDSLKFSAAASLGVGRRALVSAVASARTLHLMASGSDERAGGKSSSSSLFSIDSSLESIPFYQVLDYVRCERVIIADAFQFQIF